MSDRRRISLLILIMLSVALIVSGISITLLYRAAFNEEKARLVETAQSQARLMESVARFDAIHSQDYPGGWMEATLSQIRNSHDNYAGFGQTGEFTLAKREGDLIIFLLRHRHFDTDIPQPIPFESELAEPMRQALSNQSGTLVGFDYRGETVLAAYEPVAELDMGIVAKIDLVEIQAPFIRAGIIAGAVTLTVVLLGALLFFRITEPLLQNIKDSEEKFRGLVESSSDWIWEVDTEGVYTYTSPQVEDILGYKPEEIIGKTPFDLMPPEEAERVGEIFKSVVSQSETIKLLENVNIHKDGHLVYLETSGVPILDSTGNIQGYRGVDRDMTGRKRAEQKLNESLERLKGFDLHSTEGVYRVDISKPVPINLPQEEMVDWINKYAVVGEVNDSLAQMYGLEPEDMLGKPASDFAPNYGERAVLVLGEEGYRVKNKETEDIDKDGKSLFLLENYHGIVEDGHLISIWGAQNDITERVQADDELKERQHLIEKVLDTEPGTVYIYDLQENRNVFVNRDWLINYGYSTEETQDDENLLAKVIHPDDLPHIITHHDQLKNTDDDKSNIDIEYRIRRRDGVWRWVQSRDTIFTRNSEGQVTQILGILHDITESKQAQDELRDSERKYRQLFENMTSGFAVHEMIYDDQGKPVDYRYLEINPAFEKLTGVPVNVLLGKTVKEIMPNTEDYWIETSAKVAMTGEPTAYVNFSRELDKYYDTYLFSSEKDTFAVVFNDVTEKIKAQEEIQKLNEELKERIHELEAKNAELERFTYTVSHDLKSPLITINGFIGYLEDDATSGNMERLKEDIQRIQSAVIKMQRLLDELLELSRIGRLMNPPEEIQFEELVREALDNVYGQLEERGVTVTLSSNLPVVYGDRQRLMEVLQNLIDNAAKYMGEQASPLIEIGQQGEEDGKPIFFVRDNGIGIAPEYHEKIFGLFNKLNASSEGTGVGLALVKRIVEFHGGRIWVESEAGKGATFYFKLESGATNQS